jgi:lysophospholipase L1-like esterase
MTHSTAGRFVFFGDSICHGQHVSIDSIFATRVARDLRDRYPGLIVENRSINGNTTRQALERLSYDATSHHPDAVYVQFGINDCNVWATDFGESRVSLDAYRANLAEIIAKCRAAGARRVLLGTNHACRLGPEYSARLDRYNESVRTLASSLGVRLVDIAGAWSGHDLLLEDGVHLSQAGHDLYYGLLRPIILEEVGQAISSEGSSPSPASR